MRGKELCLNPATSSSDWRNCIVTDGNSWDHCRIDLSSVLFKKIPPDISLLELKRYKWWTPLLDLWISVPEMFVVVPKSMICYIDPSIFSSCFSENVVDCVQNNFSSLTIGKGTKKKK